MNSIEKSADLRTTLTSLFGRRQRGARSSDNIRLRLRVGVPIALNRTSGPTLYGFDIGSDAHTVVFSYVSSHSVVAHPEPVPTRRVGVSAIEVPTKFGYLVFIGILPRKRGLLECTLNRIENCIYALQRFWVELRVVSPKNAEKHKKKKNIYIHSCSKHLK